MKYYFEEKRYKLTKFGVVILILIGIAIILGIGSYFHNKNNETVTTSIPTQTKIESPESSSISLSFVGDILMHTAERKSGYNESENTYNFSGFFKDIETYFKNKDFVIGSFETPVIDAQSDKQYSGYPSFKNPPAIVEAIKNAGINAVVTANNHILDCGDDGAIETMNWLDKYKIPYTGTYKTQEQRNTNPVMILEKNNIKLAILNYTQLSNGASSRPYILNYINFDKIQADIQFAKLQKVDKIIIWLHFGNEYERQPDTYQKETVQKVATMGADIIIGSHPHVIQPFEILNVEGKKVFVAYSLGNFISNQYWRYSTDGLILNMELEKIKDKIEVKGISYVPTAVVREYKGKEIINELPVKSGSNSSDFITEAISKGVLKGGEIKFRILGVKNAIYNFENKLDTNLTQNDYIRLKTTWEDTTKLIGENENYKIFKSLTPSPLYTKEGQ